MSLLSEVKCSRCDRRYSGMRARCPYCGARRSKNGKHGPDEGGSKAKVVISILLVLVLIAAVVMLVVISTSDNPNDTQDPNDPSVPVHDDDNDVQHATGNKPVLDNNKSNDDSIPQDPNTPDIPQSDPNTPPETPDEVVDVKPKAESVAVGYLGEVKTDFTIGAGNEIQLDAIVVPAGLSETVEWSVEDDTIAVILQSGKLTALKSGMTTITVKCGEVSGTCIVRVN